MMNNPLVSVVMSVYNGEDYLREAIDSILDQSYTNFEFIIINDCSTDNSLNIIRKYKDKRIILVSNEQNMGLPASLNRAIKISKGQYIARMDSDDIAFPERLDIQVSYMENNLDIDFSGSQGRIIENQTKTNRDFNVPHSYEEIVGKLLWNSSFIHSSVIFRSNFLKSFDNVYDISFKKAQDYELWERLVFDHQAKCSNIGKVLLYYRIHSKSMTLQKDVSQFYFASKVRKRVLNRFDINGDANIDVYDAFVLGEKMSYFSYLRLSSIFNRIYKSNNVKCLVSQWNFKQAPFYVLGLRGMFIYFKQNIFRFYNLKKQLTFWIKAVYFALADLKM